MEIEIGKLAKPVTASGIISQGDEFWSAGDYDKAFSCYVEAISLDSRSRAAMEKLTVFSVIRTAEFRISEGDLEGAVAAYRAYLLLNPSNPQILCELGLRLLQLGRTDESVVLIERGFEHSPSLRTLIVTRLRSILQYSLSQPDKARQRFFSIELLSRRLPWLATEFRQEAMSVIGSTQAVCVVGMHRSGTSMLANVVKSIGIDLGPEHRLFAGNPDNPDGFFENREIVQLNEELLAFLGGAWDTPPEMDAGWEDAEGLRPLRDRAALLAAALASSKNSVWCWKDPRTCFTLPLWRKLLPNLKVIVIVRDPGSVATSLQRRGGYSTQAFGLRLWQRHYEELLAVLAGSDFLVLQYDEFFDCPEQELDRILAYLGCGISREQTEDAKVIVKAKFRHHKPLDTWRVSTIGRQLLPLFERLTLLSKSVIPARNNGF